MRIEIDKKHRVVQWSADDTTNELLFDVPDEILPEDFDENAFFYKYEGGRFIFDPEYKSDLEHDQCVAEIRYHRDTVCFPVINRGGLWYDMLTDEQKEELKAWYTAWLDAPETLVEPEMPTWLKG